MVFPFWKKLLKNCRTACFDETPLEMQNIVCVLNVHTCCNCPKVILQINIEGWGSEFLGLSQRPYGLLSSAQEI